MDTYEKHQGDLPDVMTDNILNARRSRYDYSSFLRKFLTWNEEMHINPDEFDYIYYLYGMQLYKNMPLEESGDFFAHAAVHIIQCDAKIQKDDKLSSPEEFDRYLKKVEISGGGGTDFRPVFDYVEELQKKGGMHELCGLLYFTDGLGTFPSKMPPYKTGFVFLKTRQHIKNVPPWAIRLDVAEEDLAISDTDRI